MVYDIDAADRIIERFTHYLKYILNRSDATIKNYISDINEFTKYLDGKVVSLNGEESILGVDLMQIHDYFMYLTLKGNSDATKARKLSSLKMLYKYLENKEKIIKYNPVEEMDYPNIRRKEPIYLTLEESELLLSSVDGRFKKRDYAILMVFLNCGVRLSELWSMNVDDIHAGAIKITGKGSKERIIYLNDACFISINNYTSVRYAALDEEALFTNQSGIRLSKRTIQQIVKKYCLKANLNSKISPHKLRHTAATLIYKYGKVDIRTLQRLLGHESISTTQIYTHVDDDLVREAIDLNPLSKNKANMG